jgi:hypothetical protein
MQAWEQTKVARALMLCIRSKRLTSVESVPVSEIALALLTRMSMPPKVCTACATAAWTWASKRMLQMQGKALPPAASISSAAV